MYHCTLYVEKQTAIEKKTERKVFPSVLPEILLNEKITRSYDKRAQSATPGKINRMKTRQRHK